MEDPLSMPKIGVSRMLSLLDGTLEKSIGQTSAINASCTEKEGRILLCVESVCWEKGIRRIQIWSMILD